MTRRAFSKGAVAAAMRPTGPAIRRVEILKDGEIEVPTGAGLGIEIDEARIKR